MKINNTITDSKKLNKFESITEIGTISRGKDIFLIKLALSTMEVVDMDKEEFRKYQGINAVRRKIGNLSIWTFNINTNTTESMAIISKGLNRAHEKPKMALLYRTLKSLTARFNISSLCERISFKYFINIRFLMYSDTNGYSQRQL